MTVAQLVAQLQRFPPDARVVASVGGHQLPDVHVGVGTVGPGKDPCVVIADRRAFAGLIPDMILAR